MKYNGTERRSVTFETLQTAIETNGSKLDIINGTVKRHKGNIKEIFNRLRGVEDKDVREEGVREGKTLLKTSTRNMFIVVIMATGLYIAGVREIRSQKQQAVQILKAQVVQNKDVEKDYIKERFKGIEDRLLSILTRSMKGGTE